MRSKFFQKKHLFESEKGVLLLIIFFVAGISLAIVLGVSIILFNEIKMIRSIGYSVVAFCAADTGLEKTLYYDKQRIPEEGTRGLCNICNSCADTDCLDCEVVSGDDCDPLTCSDCVVRFSSSFNNKTYGVTVAVSEPQIGESDTIINSFGSYEKTTRAIELVFETVAGAPTPKKPIITDAFVHPFSTPAGTVLFIYATISDADPGVDDTTTYASIQKPDENEIAEVVLNLISGDSYSGHYSGTWIGTEIGAYYVDITACDSADPRNCAEVENI